MAARRVAGLLALLGIAVTAGCNGAFSVEVFSGPASRLAMAARTASWQIQLSGPADLSVSASVFELDAFDTTAATVARLHRSGRMAVCHLMVGVAEVDRPDAARYPTALLGHPDPAVPDGFWLDVKAVGQLRSQLADRLQLCQEKGFDGVDADGVDGYLHDTGFALTVAEQIAFDGEVIRLARRAHLAAGLRLPPGQIGLLGLDPDFAVTVNCFASPDCPMFARITGVGRPVFDIEYGDTTFCPLALVYRISAIRKRPGLDAWRQTC